MRIDYKRLIETLEFLIFGTPSIALDFGEWYLYGEEMRTRQRPDRSDGGKNNKTCLRFYGEGENRHLYLYYNGASFEHLNSTRVTEFLADKYGKDWMRIVCKMYGISREDFTTSDNDFKPRDFKRQTLVKPKEKIEYIPQTIVSPTYDRTRDSVLRGYLSGVFGEGAVLRAWELFRVGDAFDGRSGGVMTNPASADAAS